MEDAVVEAFRGTVPPRTQRHGNLYCLQHPHGTDETLTPNDPAGGHRREELRRAKLRLEHVPPGQIARCHDVAYRQFVLVLVFRYRRHGIDVILRIVDNILVVTPMLHKLLPSHNEGLRIFRAAYRSAALHNVPLFAHSQDHQSLVQIIQVFPPEISGVRRDAAIHEEMGFLDFRHYLLPRKTLRG